MRWAIAPLAVGGLTILAQALSSSAWLGLLVLGLGTSIWVALQYQESENGSRQVLPRALEALGEGRIDPATPNELRPLFERIHAQLRGAAQVTEERSAQLTALTEQVRRGLSDVENHAHEQEEAVEETASLFLNINNSIRGVNQEIQNLAHSNEETGASLSEMGSAIEQVAQSALTLRETVESSTASIHEMSASVQRVAESSDEVQHVAEETAAATTEMDRAIHEVGEHVRGASTLTQRVSQHALEGSHAVGSTIQGIDHIRVQTLAAKRALEGLAARVGEVGEIATFIGTISDETNLLSLNAAIIAAQAGEHGKAFAVVADQVKTLSHRTSASAKQIGEVIRAVQAESENAVSAMAAGIESVEEGVERSHVAGTALEVILAAAGEASGQVAEISRATEEQAVNSKHVASAAQRVSEHVHHISRAMGEQSNGAEGLLSNATAYLDMSRHIETAMDEQKATARFIMENSQAITDLIALIQENTASHEQASGKVAQRFERLLASARESATLIQNLGANLGQRGPDGSP
jgi:methyl-accepting chemotaxis protein